VPWLAQQGRYINLPGSLPAHPSPITDGHFILKTDHVAWEWPITLKELPSILNKLAWWFTSNLQLPDGGRWDRSEARELAYDAIMQAAPPLPRFPATRVAPPPPPAHAWSRRHPLGVVGEPAAGRISSASPRGWLEPARGEFPAPNWPLGPPPVPHAGFLGHWEAQKSVECIRYDFLRSGCD
jgi:hypothetical protein